MVSRFLTHSVPQLGAPHETKQKINEKTAWKTDERKLKSPENDIESVKSVRLVPAIGGWKDLRNG